MIGYWLVVGMVAVAVSAVVIAVQSGTDSFREGDPERPRHPVWVALGASDATGDGTPDPAADNWVAQLAAVLPHAVEIHNLGVGGSTLAEARRDQLPQALALNPDVVTCWLVVNDLANGVPLPAYEQELAVLLDDLASTGATVILGNVPNLADVPALSGSDVDRELLREAVAEWNAALHRIAGARGAEVVDLFTESINPDDLGPDGFHPSRLGHARLAAVFRPAVERALAQARGDPGAP